LRLYSTIKSKSLRETAFIHVLKYIIPLGILIFSTWCGLGFTYDSHDYLSAAGSFREGFYFLNANGSAYFIHAPFFPIWISWVGENPLLMIKSVHIVLFFLSLMVIDKILFITINSLFIRILGFFLISLAVGVHMVHNFIWTEPTFLFFFVLHNLFLILYLKKEKLSLILWMGLLALLMGITRNAAVFIVLTTSTCLWYFSRNSRIKVSITYLILGLLGFMIWNFYALVIVNKLNTFKEGGSLYQDLLASFWVYPDMISKWFMPSVVPLFVRALVLLMVLSLMIYSLFRVFSNPVPKIFLIQFLIYWVLIVPIIVVENSEAEKLMAILYPFFIIVILMFLDKEWEKLLKPYRAIIIIGLVGWLSYTSARTVKNSIMWHQNNCNREIGYFISVAPTMASYNFFLNPNHLNLPL